MFETLTPYYTLLLSAFSGFILISIIGGIMFGKLLSADLEKFKKLSVIAKSADFIFFLIIGFSAIPILITLLTSALVANLPGQSLPLFLQQNSPIIIGAVWAIFTLGIIIAFPSIRKSEFFDPEIPENLKK